MRAASVLALSLVGCQGLRSITPCDPGVPCLLDTDTDASGGGNGGGGGGNAGGADDTPAEPTSTEDCDNRRDDDDDGDVDCQDDGCQDVCDADGDGYISAALRGDDCDDADENVYPTAPETCDEVDNDCDQAIDDEDDDVTGAPLWYYDADGDGFGDPTLSQYLCDPGSLSVAQSAGDCDDANASVSPGRAEVTCDGINNDCSGGTPDAVDADGDGANACSDCNDGNAAIAPGFPDTCGDTIDSNCDGYDCGYIFEDGFETGTMSASWTFSGAVSWFTTDNNKQHSGTWAAASGRISDSQLSTMQITVTLPAAGVVSFWHQESSEPSYDFLKFIVDGTELGRWAGTNAYQQASFPLAAGTHEIKWRYEKDVSLAVGDDRVWVDDIVVRVGP